MQECVGRKAKTGNRRKRMREYGGGKQKTEETAEIGQEGRGTTNKERKRRMEKRRKRKGGAGVR